MAPYRIPGRHCSLAESALAPSGARCSKPQFQMHGGRDGWHTVFRCTALTTQPEAEAAGSHAGGSGRYHTPGARRRKCRRFLFARRARPGGWDSRSGGLYFQNTGYLYGGGSSDSRSLPAGGNIANDTLAFSRWRAGPACRRPLSSPRQRRCRSDHHGRHLGAALERQRRSECAALLRRGRARRLEARGRRRTCCGRAHHPAALACRPAPRCCSLKSQDHRLHPVKGQQKDADPAQRRTLSPAP